MDKISISVNGVWAGDGKIVDGEIRDCAAQLGGDQDETEVLYSLIEDAIEGGRGDELSTRRDGGEEIKISWSIG